MATEEMILMGMYAGTSLQPVKAMGGNWPPKTLKPFVDNGLSMGGN
jgi:hypothetical protein